MQNKHREFIKKIKAEFPETQSNQKNSSSSEKGRKEQEVMDLQEELERRFNELFGDIDGD